MRRNKPQSVGAKRKLESVTRTAESRRAHREAKGHAGRVARPLRDGDLHRAPKG